MNIRRIVIPLDAAAPHVEQLRALQRAFADACNLLAPMVQDHRCWNRVALHHLAYRSLREAMPELGSQMACNAIYSVCRAARFVFQHPSSPFHVSRWGERPLPLLRFAPNCPVYFDRHTLSLRNGRVSLFTLEGRLRFDVGLSADDERAFRALRLREVMLTSGVDGRYSLTFVLQEDEHESSGERSSPKRVAEASSDWPEYLMVEEAQ